MAYNNRFTTPSIFRLSNAKQINQIKSEPFTKDSEWEFIFTHYIDLYEVNVFLQNALKTIDGLVIKDYDLFLLSVNLVELVAIDCREQSEDFSDAFLSILEGEDQVEIFNRNVEAIGEIADRSFQFVRSHLLSLFGSEYLDRYNGYEQYFWHYARRVGQYQAQFNILREND